MPKTVTLTFERDGEMPVIIVDAGPRQIRQKIPGNEKLMRIAVIFTEENELADLEAVFSK